MGTEFGFYVGFFVGLVLGAFMSESYFYKDKMTPEFFQLIGEVVVAWSTLERSIDLLLSKSGVFHPKDGNAILAWKMKTKELRGLLDGNPNLSKKWLNETVDQLIDVAKIRNTIIHGYCLGLNTSEPPRIKFVAARFQAEVTDQMKFTPTADQLREMIKFIKKIEDEIAPVTLNALFNPKRKAHKVD